MSPDDSAVDPERPWVPPALRGLGAVLTVLILIQAMLAGQHLFGSAGIEIHGYLGNASFALGVAAACVALFGRAPTTVRVIAVALVALLFTQIGLGYAGRTSAGAASWHIPIGVASLGLTTALLTAVLLPPARGPSTP